MAVNIKYLMEKGLSYHDFTNLQLIAQNSEPEIYQELIINMNHDDLTRLHALDLITLVSLKRKTDHDYTRIRLSKKGKEVFRNAQIVDYTEADEKLLSALEELYHKLGKPVGNEVKVKQLIAWFRTETQYSRKMLFIAIKAFLGKYEEENKIQYIPSLENLLWKSNNVFTVKWSLADSRLYQFIQENKKELNGNTSN